MQHFDLEHTLVHTLKPSSLPDVLPIHISRLTLSHSHGPPLLPALSTSVFILLLDYYSCTDCKMYYFVQLY